MNELAYLNVEIERALKDEADAVARDMGMTLSMAISFFLRQMVSEKALPFQLHPADDKAAQFRQLIGSIRAENAERGFLTEDEINQEIQAYRKERRESKA